MLGDAPLSPEPRALKRLLLIAARVHESRELIKRKHDVRAERMLDLHRELRCEPVFGAIDEAAEIHAIVVHVGEALLALLRCKIRAVGRARAVAAREGFGEHLLKTSAEAHDLEAARVGVRGAIPVHEYAEPTCLINEVVARLEIQVVGIREDRLRAQLCH